MHLQLSPLEDDQENKRRIGNTQGKLAIKQITVNTYSVALHMTVQCKISLIMLYV